MSHLNNDGLRHNKTIESDPALSDAEPNARPGCGAQCKT